MNSSNQKTQSIVGCFKIPSDNAGNVNLFTLASGHSLNRAKNKHILCQTITRTIPKQHIRIFYSSEDS